jgi:hypothetical protein
VSGRLIPGHAPTVGPLRAPYVGRTVHLSGGSRPYGRARAGRCGVGICLRRTGACLAPRTLKGRFDRRMRTPPGAGAPRSAKVRRTLEPSFARKAPVGPYRALPKRAEHRPLPLTRERSLVLASRVLTSCVPRARAQARRERTAGATERDLGVRASVARPSNGGGRIRWSTRRAAGPPASEPRAARRPSPCMEGTRGGIAAAFRPMRRWLPGQCRGMRSRSAGLCRGAWRDGPCVSGVTRVVLRGRRRSRPRS